MHALAAVVSVPLSDLSRHMSETDTSSLELVDARTDFDALHALVCVPRGPLLVPEDVHENLRYIVKYFGTMSPASSLPTSVATSPVPTRSPSRAGSPINIIASQSKALTVQHNVKITRQQTAQKLYTYDVNTHLEYPETSAEGHIGHLFKMDAADWKDNKPRQTVCYSQGAPMVQNKKGKHAYCKVLVDSKGKMVPCVRLYSTCKFSPFKQLSLHASSSIQI